VPEGVVETDAEAYEVIPADIQGEWLVVRESGWSGGGGEAAAIIKAHLGGVYCYPNSPPYEQLGPYRSVSSAFAAFSYVADGMG
jgi:hypothetical protein